MVTPIGLAMKEGIFCRLLLQLSSVFVGLGMKIINTNIKQSNQFVVRVSTLVNHKPDLCIYLESHYCNTFIVLTKVNSRHKY